MSKPKYKVDIGKQAMKNLKKMDKATSSLILSWINENLRDCDDPYRFGKPLRYDLKGSWRYRVGDYRILSEIEEDKVVIVLLEVKHRKDAYK